jgi:hypothetical protein
MTTVHVDESTPLGRRVVASVESSSEWRRQRYGPYWVDLIQERWYCTCWQATPDRPCKHVADVRKAMEGQPPWTSR